MICFYFTRSTLVLILFTTVVYQTPFTMCDSPDTFHSSLVFYKFKRLIGIIVSIFFSRCEFESFYYGWHVNQLCSVHNIGRECTRRFVSPSLQWLTRETQIDSPIGLHTKTYWCFRKELTDFHECFPSYGFYSHFEISPVSRSLQIFPFLDFLFCLVAFLQIFIGSICHTELLIFISNCHEIFFTLFMEYFRFFLITYGQTISHGWSFLQNYVQSFLNPSKLFSFYPFKPLILTHIWSQKLKMVLKFGWIMLHWSVPRSGVVWCKIVLIQ